MNNLLITPVSITVELENSDIYYSSHPYDVFLNDELVLHGVNKNVFTLYNLDPETIYDVKAMGEEMSFITKAVTDTHDIMPSGSDDDTKMIQNVIDNAKADSLIRIHSGSYMITSLLLRDDITIEIKKDAYIKALIDESKYEELDEYFISKNGERCVLGTWEGNAHVMKKSFITGIENSNVTIVGEGIIDGDAQNSAWWVGYREKPYARPHMVFLNRCDNINIVGVKFINSPCWTLHPFYSSNIGFYDFMIDNPKISPNTDGIDPQSCTNVNIIGIHFSVGDDCISIKSGKIEMIEEFYRPCINVTIRNCLMEYGHGAVVLGSEMSSGINNVLVERCYFRKTDRGLRIKTRRGRGNRSIVDNVTFRNIRMDEVLSPLTINMYYNCDPGSNIEYIYTKKPLPVDERTPYLGEFTFDSIHATGCEYVVGYFYGLPEMPIKGVNITNSDFSFKEECGYGKAIMMLDPEICHKRGIVAKNVGSIKLLNVRIEGNEGKLFDLENVNEVIEK